MKMYSYEIRYNNNGEITSELTHTKTDLVYRYIQIFTEHNFNYSELKAFRNGIDITAQINRFLMK